MAFIEELDYNIDVNEILKILKPYKDMKQITLNNRGDISDPVEQLSCGSGGLQNWYDIKTYEDIKDKDFYWYELNDLFQDTYIEKLYYEIKGKFTVGRSRAMTLYPGSCYSYHYDFSKRIHIPLITNEYCKFFDKDWNNYHLKVGKVYLTDTTQCHTAGNFGKEKRVHIVMAVK